MSFSILGQPGVAEPPQWTQGERGGRADDVLIPESLSLAWKFPAADESRFAVTAPLMPLDGAVYAAGVRDGSAQFIKLDADASATDEARRCWSHPFDGSITTAPIGCGRRVFVIESNAPSATSSTLWCLSAEDGSRVWSRTLAEGSSGLTLDSERVFVWTNTAQLDAFDVASGAPLWEASIGGSIAVGAPAVASNILFAATETNLVARDAPTGTLLWQVGLSEKPTAGPFVEGLHLVLPYDGEHAVHHIVDGALARRQPAVHEADRWLIPDGTGNPVTPRVALKGRVYFATEAGSVVCLATVRDSSVAQ